MGGKVHNFVNLPNCLVKLKSTAWDFARQALAFSPSIWVQLKDTPFWMLNSCAWLPWCILGWFVFLKKVACLFFLFLLLLYTDRIVWAISKQTYLLWKYFMWNNVLFTRIQTYTVSSECEWISDGLGVWGCWNVSLTSQLILFSLGHILLNVPLLYHLGGLFGL